jgi:hypothetical protein
MCRKIEKKYENPFDNILIDLCEYCSPFFHKLNFSPNDITTLSLIFGILSIYFLYKNNLVLFIVLYIISYFFDCFDGFYARKYKMVTKFGDIYDHVKDISVGVGIIIVLIITNKCSTTITVSIIITFIILTILANVNLGCQELIYNTSDESPILNNLTKLCPGDPKETIKFTRYFGCGTYVILSLCLILIMKKC